MPAARATAAWPRRCRPGGGGGERAAFWDELVGTSPATDGGGGERLTVGEVCVRERMTCGAISIEVTYIPF